MIRYHKKEQVEIVSFFPLLSVLCSAMGGLLFILMNVTLLGFHQAKQVVIAGTPNESAMKHSLQPICVECRENELIIHPKKGKVLLSEIKDKNQGISGPYGQLLQHLKTHRDSKYLLFLIRRDGFATFQQAMAMARISGGGPLNPYGNPPIGGFAVGYELVLRPGPIEVPDGI